MCAGRVESGTGRDSEKTPSAASRLRLGSLVPPPPNSSSQLAPTTGLIADLDLGCEGLTGHWKIKLRTGLGTGATSSRTSRQEGWGHRLKVGDKLSCS